MNIIFFFFTLFQNFMIPLDSSWWDLFKSALAPQFTICPPVCFGTYLWIIFNFTSVPRIDRRRGAKKSENGGGMNINFFFFTLFQNFMVPLDSSWWDLFKSALAPQYTICTPVAFGTYLWIFFIFTSVPILKKSCCRKNQIFSRNIIPFRRT